MFIKVKGIGLTKFGELWDISLIDLLKEAADAALNNAKMSIQDIDAVYIGSMFSGEVCSQSHLGSIISSLYNVSVPAFRIEAACASGGVAVFQAIQAIKCGDYKNVLVIGIEKMTDFSSEILSSLLMQAASEEERLSGATFPGLYALMARAHMGAFGTTREDMAMASVLAHKNAVHNPIAQFKKPITVENVLKSSPIAEPLHLLDCSPVSDGAAAVLLSNEDPNPKEKEAFILNQSFVTGPISLSERDLITEIYVTKQASEQIFKDSGLTPKDIDLVEVHDCFSIATLLALEDIGFVQKGEGGKALKRIMEGDTSLPALNISGGLKASGHPVGATGVKQVAEVALHLQNNGGDRQVKNAKYGLTHNVGGTGGTCVMHLLGGSER